MLAREAQTSDQAAPSASTLDPNVRGLLDHIAVELAEEYIRLMEAAAEAEVGSPGADPNSIAEDDE